MAGGNALSTVSAGLGIFGILTLLAQFGIDLVVGFMSADHAAMSILFDQVQADPGVPFLIYQGGPLLFSSARSRSSASSPSSATSRPGRPSWSCSTASCRSSTRTSCRSGPPLPSPSPLSPARSPVPPGPPPLPLPPSCDRRQPACRFAFPSFTVPKDRKKEARLDPVSDLPFFATVRSRLKSLPPLWVTRRSPCS